MPNHVHLVAVPKNERALRYAIGETHERYTKMVNVRSDWRGYLWQGRFSSFPMDERHLYFAARYIELNPVRAAICRRAEDYPWSSARAHLLKDADPVIQAGPLEAMIPDWRQYLNEAIDPDLIEPFRRHGRTGRPMGSQEFVEKLEERLGRQLLPKKSGPKRMVSLCHEG